MNKDLPSFIDIEPLVKGLHNIFVKKDYGRFGIVVASFLITFILLVVSFSMYMGLAKQQVKSDIAPSRIPRIIITGTVSPTPNDGICSTEDFSTVLWNLNPYKKEGDYYIPVLPVKGNFHYPKMIYKPLISGMFNKIYFRYIADMQDATSSTSATLHIALYYKRDEKTQIEQFEFNFPEPNRQLIEFRNNTPDYTPSPVPTLPKEISPSGTHEVTISATKAYPNDLNDNTVLYTLKGNFVDASNTAQPVTYSSKVKPPTSDPKGKDFVLVIGTGQKGKLKIEKYEVCDPN